MLTVATLAAPGLADGASAELDRQSIVLRRRHATWCIRNRPPLRVHRLRFTAAAAAHRRRG